MPHTPARDTPGRSTAPIMAGSRGNAVRQAWPAEMRSPRTRRPMTAVSMPLSWRYIPPTSRATTTSASTSCPVILTCGDWARPAPLSTRKPNEATIACGASRNTP